MKTSKFALLEMNGQSRIEVSDLSSDQLHAIHTVMRNNIMDSDDYKMKSPANPFLQGYQAPSRNGRDGWVLIEFWTDNQEGIQAFVDYLNNRLGLEG
jgi:hypothetical protein